MHHLSFLHRFSLILHWLSARNMNSIEQHLRHQMEEGSRSNEWAKSPKTKYICLENLELEKLNLNDILKIK